MAVDYTPSFDPADVNSDYGSTGGDITVPTFKANMKPFRFWCQRALPLVYDDSLSYYEVLCKVVDQMNGFLTDLQTATGSIGEFAQQFVVNQQFLNNMAAKLGQDVDTLETYINDRMDDFTAAYQQLQSYVNNYFDNLDVQVEINNKLDAMAADGTFNTLFNPVITAWMTEKTAQIDEDLAEQNETLAEQNGRISVLEGRMDTFSSLPSGSTSGNAELLDIRTNFLGETYPTAGDAVRASDMIAGGFRTRATVADTPDWAGDESSSLYNTATFNISNLKGAKFVCIYNTLADNVGTGGRPTIFGGNSVTPDANAVDVTNLLAYNFEYTLLKNYHDTNPNATGYRYMAAFDIPSDAPYNYLYFVYTPLFGSDDTPGAIEYFDSPNLIAYFTMWSKTPIDPTLTQPYEAADAKATGDAISSIMEYGSTSLSDYITNGTYYPGSLTIKIDGINADISGTTTGTGFTHSALYNNQNSFPNGLIAGQKIQITQECDNPYIHFMFLEYINGTEEVKVNISGNGTVQHTISEHATGCTIRRSIENGHTYNNVISKGYIFTTLTKQQIETAINENTARIEEAENSYNAIAELMPTDYVNVEVATSDGLVNRWNEISTPSGYAYIKQAVVEGEKYKVSGYYVGGNFPAYFILNGDSVLSFYNPTTTGAFNGVEVTIPQNATHIVVNGNTSNPASLSKYEMVKASVGGAKSFDSILVGVSTDYAYNDINSAIVANPNSIISVDYGTYDTEIKNIATDKQIIGKDRNLCVLYGTGRNYDTPPIEISGGVVKHFTVNMENDSDAEHKGYCLHSDTSDCIGKTLIVEDCKFTCSGQHTIGMGIWQNENVLYKDCEFIYNDEEETPAGASFFAHNSGTSDGVAVVKFHNCIFRGSGYALKLSSYSSNCTMQFEFIDCTFESDTLTGDEMVWTDYVTGDTHDQSNLHRFKGKMPLLKTSHGNNVSIANYTA